MYRERERERGGKHFCLDIQKGYSLAVHVTCRDILH